MEVLERSDEHPNCPHCKTSLTQIWFRELKTLLGRRYIYFCPSCRGVLGITHRKGFWMG